MTFHVNLPDSFAAPAHALIASALSVHLDHTPHRPTIAERAARVDWQKVAVILARVPAVPPATNC